MSSPVQESPAHSISSISGQNSVNDDPIVGTIATDSDSENDKNCVNAEINNPRQTFTSKMLNLSREIAVMLILCVIYSELTSERPLKVTKSPLPYPFFSPNSPVTDWYRGQITLAIEEARTADISFVMFYAPWDAESQRVRREFEIVASYMQDEVVFVAINCWQPGSECKRQYSKVYKWPVLIAYPTHGRGIQYSGPLDSTHMIQFLRGVCRPVVRGVNVNELLGKHEVVVAAYLNTLPGSYEYAVFYSTALREIERDPLRDTVFVIFPVAAKNVPLITLYNWNKSLIYDDELDTESLSNWVSTNSKQIATWVTSSGRKSRTLGKFLQQGPTLIIFTPRNPMLEGNDYFNLLREIGYEYNSCASSTYIKRRKLLVTKQRLLSKSNLRNLILKCEKRPQITEKIITNVENVWINNTQNECHCHNDNSIEKPIHENQTLLKLYLKMQCRDLRLAQKYSSPHFQTVKNDINVTGLGCVKNVTLNFIAFDSLNSYHFAERLGIDLSKSSDNSAGVIVNEKMETHHVMVGNITPVTLRNFVFNFTRKILDRDLFSKVHVKNKINHIYPTVHSTKSEDVSVIELTSESFLPTILKTNKVVLVFYYSKQCAFCSGIGYKFLTVSKMLALLSEMVFARIDGDINLLPWEYTMESYPTILFFPSNGKSESRAFPQTLPITVPNLLGFILTNVEPTLKLKIMWIMCNRTKFPDEKVKCLTSLRLEILTVIDMTLREWRLTNRKHKVLHKLQFLRHLHLLFAHLPGETVKIETSLRKLRV